MTRLNDIKINLRINLIYNAAFILILGSMGFYLSYAKTEKITEETQNLMFGQVGDLEKLLKLQVTEKQKQLNIAINLAEDLFNHEGTLRETRPELQLPAVDQITREMHLVKVPTWQLGNKFLHSDVSLVDQIKVQSVETVTIFQKIDKGYLRISTNVRTADGNRAIGTYIPSSSEVIQTIEQGQDYRGRANVNGQWYRTVYRPIKINGDVKGILYVGTPESELSSIRKHFLDKKFFETGYPFIVDMNGKFILHPTQEGDNVADQDFFKQLLSQEKSEGTVNYEWEGKPKTLYYKFSEETKMYICASLYESEFMASIVRERTIISLAILIGLVIFIIINLIVGRSITAPLKQSVAFAESFAKGQLYATVNIDQKDEIGMMTGSLRKMKDSLIKTVIQIKLSALQIATISEQVSSSADQIAEAASEQAASTEELSSSMEEMASNIAQTAENAKATELIAVLAVEKIEAVQVAVLKTIESMKLIAEKITIIDEIAEKTDLLAVNAAIEAAKAGESGKGFAVVAHEVRKLAENSSGASRDINKISGQSVSTAENAGILLANLMPEIKKTASLVQDISAAALEQDSGALQISNAIQQLTMTVQQNSAASEQLAAGAKQMAFEAETLKESVAFLQTDVADNSSVKELFGMLDKYTDQINIIKDRIIAAQNPNAVTHHSHSNVPIPNKKTDNNRIVKSPGNDLGFKMDLDPDSDFEKIF